MQEVVQWNSRRIKETETPHAKPEESELFSIIYQHNVTSINPRSNTSIVSNPIRACDENP